MPGDAEDHERDREPDQRVRDVDPDRDRPRAEDDAEADEAVGARVIPVGDEGGAGEAAPGAEPDPGGRLVAEEADDPGQGQNPEVRERLRVEQARDALEEGDEGADQDRQDDEEAGDPLGACAPEQEGDPERDGGERVPDVVDQVGEQGDAVAEDEDRSLRERGRAQDREADADRPQARAGTRDRRVDQPVRVPVAAPVPVAVLVTLVVPWTALLAQPGRPVRACSWCERIAVSSSATWWSCSR